MLHGVTRSLGVWASPTLVRSKSTATQAIVTVIVWMHSLGCCMCTCTELYATCVSLFMDIQLLFVWLTFPQAVMGSPGTRLGSSVCLDFLFSVLTDNSLQKWIIYHWCHFLCPNIGLCPSSTLRPSICSRTFTRSVGLARNWAAAPDIIPPGTAFLV